MASKNAAPSSPPLAPANESGTLARQPPHPHRLSGVLLFNVVLPLSIFGLASQYTSTLNAMILYTVPPLGKCLYELVGNCRVDYISMVQLGITGVGIAVMLVTNDPRVGLLKDILPPMVIAVVILLSALLQNSFNMVARIPTNARVRNRFKGLALVVGSVIFAEDSLRLYLVFHAPLSTMLVLNPVLGIGTGMSLTLWVVYSVKHTPELTDNAAAAAETTPLLS
ncbi:hypothetical protein DYB37_006631 [Aphanomyces astaci]|uniref:Uncharacterized protein n=1 Tax=Aphanomyces astaci TaxID=112090 RepID=A0A3L6UY12_APHAT|nr:hypothetical protein DYB35_003673 [Aphanomyces astaci]RHZ18095.1 hypothetical protein DYB37_006631 [Aphanomyces astaci]RLO01471.1 hypothetical protein DYB28_008657 [Aphanomyces astaci]